MMLMGLLGCGVWLLPLVAVVVLCVVVLWRSLTSGPVAGLGASALCGGCGYEVTDVPGTSCPECGRSLLRVGIATRSLVGRYRSSMLQAQLAWIVVWGFVATLILWLVLTVSSAAMFGGMVAAGGGAVACTGVISPPASATHGDVAFDVSSTGFGGLTAVELSLTDADGAVHTLLLDGTYEPLSASVSTDGVEVWSDLSVMVLPAMDEWFAAAGIDDETDPQSQSRTDLSGYAAMVTASPMMADFSQGTLNWSTQTVTASSGTMGPNAFTPSRSSMIWSAVGIGFVVIGYIGGVVCIVMRRKRILRLV